MMIVALDDRSSASLARMLDAAMFKVVREETLVSAAENMISSMPHVIVIGESAMRGENASFTENAAAIGAEIILVTRDSDPDEIRFHLCRAADRALARRAG